MNKFVLRLAAFSIFSIIALTSAQISIPFSSYDLFDIEGGYCPGSILIINRKKISSPIFILSSSKSRIVDTSFLNYEYDTLPKYEFDKTETFKTKLKADSKFSQLPLSVRLKLTRIKKVSQKVNNGTRQRFSDGTIVLPRLITMLPKSELELLKGELSKKKKLFMISEALEYSKDTVSYDWGIDVSTELNTTIKKYLSVDNENSFQAEGKLHLKYNRKIYVAYKSIPLEKRHFDLINIEIAKRDSFGDPVKCFIDNDSDSFGDPKNFFVYLEKKIPEGFVKNGDDPDDNNKENVPGAKLWFRDEDGDKLGTKDISKYSRDEIEGYVLNSKDVDDGDPSIGETFGDSVTVFFDNDGDGYGNPKIFQAAVEKKIPTGYVQNGDDPDDNNKENVPGATLWYRDSDVDKFGNASILKYSVSQPEGYVSNFNDLDDTNPALGDKHEFDSLNVIIVTTGDNKDDTEPVEVSLSLNNIISCSKIWGSGNEWRKGDVQNFTLSLKPKIALSDINSTIFRLYKHPDNGQTGCGWELHVAISGHLTCNKWVKLVEWARYIGDTHETPDQKTLISINANGL